MTEERYEQTTGIEPSRRFFVNQKVVPVSKSVGDDMEWSGVSRSMEKNNLDHLYYQGVFRFREDGNHECLADTKENSGWGFFFRLNDLDEYK